MLDGDDLVGTLSSVDRLKVNRTVRTLLRRGGGPIRELTVEEVERYLAMRPFHAVVIHGFRERDDDNFTDLLVPMFVSRAVPRKGSVLPTDMSEEAYFWGPIPVSGGANPGTGEGGDLTAAEGLAYAIHGPMENSFAYLINYGVDIANVLRVKFDEHNEACRRYPTCPRDAGCLDPHRFVETPLALVAVDLEDSETGWVTVDSPWGQKRVEFDADDDVDEWVQMTLMDAMC